MKSTLCSVNCERTQRCYQRRSDHCLNGELSSSDAARVGKLLSVIARRGQATIADVAALAQVSIGTVSKALNGRGQLRDETRDRVLAAAEQLGFLPNTLARSLLSGRSFTVGLITTDSFGRFTIPIMLGAEDALGAGQISVFLCDGRGDPI